MPALVKGGAIKGLSLEWIKGKFGGGATGRDRYRRYIAEGISEESPLLHREKQIFLGGKAFLEAVLLYRESLPSKESLPDLVDLYPVWRKRAERCEMVQDAIKRGYSQSRIAEHFGIAPSTVSRAATRFFEANPEIDRYSIGRQREAA